MQWLQWMYSHRRRENCQREGLLEVCWWLRTQGSYQGSKVKLLAATSGAGTILLVGGGMPAVDSDLRSERPSKMEVEVG